MSDNVTKAEQTLTQTSKLLEDYTQDGKGDLVKANLERLAKWEILTLHGDECPGKFSKDGCECRPARFPWPGAKDLARA